MDTKICSTCKIEKPLEEYHNDQRNDMDGKHYRCKECYHHYHNTPSMLHNWRGEPNVKEGAIEVLTALGYDVESETPIHIQFENKLHEKYGDWRKGS